MLPGFSLAMFGASGGVVPDPVSWDDIDGDGLGGGSTNAQIISGIGEAILLRLVISGVTLRNNASGIIYPSASGVLAAGAISEGDETDFIVNPNDVVLFSVTGSGSPAWSYDATATIKYRPAGSALFSQTLDTFLITASAET